MPVAPAGGGILQRIWRSIFPHPIVLRTERDRRRAVLEFFVLHLRPVRVRRSTIRYTHTYGLGGSSLVLLCLLVASGLLLMLVYEPTPEGAYDSVVELQDGLLFGGLVRNIHHWSANLLVAVALLHLTRVLCTGAYHGPRRFNWVIGLLLLGGVLAANFTGYLLPWDQLGYWAVTICTGMLGYIPWVGSWLQEVVGGGAGIGGGTLLLFYTLHTTLLPVGLLLLAGFHFWRVRKAGGVVDPDPAPEDGERKVEYVSTLPHLLVPEVAAGLALIAVVMVLAVLVDAPLEAAANPGMSTNPAKAPWYFVGFQELQLHFHPLFAVVVLPLLVTTFLLSIPYLRYQHELSGRWLLGATGRRTAALGAGLSLVLTPALVLLDELVLQPGAGLPSPVSRGLVPLLVLLAAALSFRALLVRRFAASRAEVVQALFVVLLVSLSVLTCIGVWCRGPGMALVWPWS